MGKMPGYIFGAHSAVLCPDTCKADYCDYSIEKRDFLPNGVNKHYFKIGTKQLEDKSWNTGACAYIQYVMDTLWQETNQSQGVTDVLDGHFLHGLEAGEVNALIPGVKLPQIDSEVCYELP